MSIYGLCVRYKWIASFCAFRLNGTRGSAKPDGKLPKALGPYVEFHKGRILDLRPSDSRNQLGRRLGVEERHTGLPECGRQAAGVEFEFGGVGHRQVESAAQVDSRLVRGGAVFWPSPIGRGHCRTGRMGSSGKRARAHSRRSRDSCLKLIREAGMVRVAGRGTSIEPGSRRRKTAWRSRRISWSAGTR